VLRSEAYLRRAVDFLYLLRRQGGPDYGLAVPKSTKSAYSHHEAAAEGDATWNDGRVLLEPEEEAKMLARAQRKAEVALKQSKEVAVRSHHAIWLLLGRLLGQSGELLGQLGGGTSEIGALKGVQYKCGIKSQRAGIGHSTAHQGQSTGPAGPGILPIYQVVYRCLKCAIGSGYE
jgi:hypothetical protein